MKNILFKNCWVGTDVGNGEYEGGSCPDILITNVPDNIVTEEDLEDLFDTYLYVHIGFDDYEEKEFDSKILTTKYRGSVKPTQITKQEDLKDCWESFIEVDYQDLRKWYFDEEDYEEYSRLDTKTLTERVNRLIKVDGILYLNVEKLIYIEDQSCITLTFTTDNNVSKTVDLDSTEYSKEQLDYLLGKTDKCKRTSKFNYTL